MGIYAIIAAVWLGLFTLYYLWPRLNRRSVQGPSLHSRIISTSYLQDEAQLLRYRRQVEEAKAALSLPAARRVPMVSETAPSAPVARPEAAATVGEPATRPTPAPPQLEPLPAAVAVAIARRPQPLAQAFGEGAPAVRTAASVDAAEVAYLRSQVTELRRELAAAQSRPRPEPEVVVIDHVEEVEELQAQVIALQEKLATREARPRRTPRPERPRSESPRPDTPKRRRHPAGDFTELPPSLRALVEGIRTRQP